MGDARPRFFDELCSRSGGDAREAMTVGCKPTISSQQAQPGFRSHCARPYSYTHYGVREASYTRGVLSEFRAARTCASYWFDNGLFSYY